MNSGRLIKTGAGVVAVVVLLALVINWVGDYRQATASKKAPKSSSTSVEATPAVDQREVVPKPSDGTKSKPAETKPAAKKVLIIQVDGLNFRSKPSGESRAMRGLNEGEKVVLLATEGDWYKVQDESGATGYITSNPTYTKLEK